MRSIRARRGDSVIDANDRRSRAHARIDHLIADSIRFSVNLYIVRKHYYVSMHDTH